MNSRHVLTILNILLSAILAGAFESAPSMIFVGSNYSGHEEITRQALNNIAKKIQDTQAASLFSLSDLSFDLKPEPKGLFGYKAKNMVILGNFATDFPNQAQAVSLANFWNDKNFAEFENPNTQAIHFLRNYKTPITLDSAYNTCFIARSKIKYIVSKALLAWELGDKSTALFLIGHASHTIQDSFSPAHTLRDTEERNNNLINVCFFGNQMYKKFDLRSRGGNKHLCYHSAPDSRDMVWSTDSKQYKAALSKWTSEQVTQCDRNNDYPETDQAKTACLNNEARLSRLATEKFLFLVFNQITEQTAPKKPIADFLNLLDTNLFDGPVGDAELDRKMANGIMRCEALSHEEIVGSEPIEGGG